MSKKKPNTDPSPSAGTGPKSAREKRAAVKAKAKAAAEERRRAEKRRQQRNTALAVGAVVVVIGLVVAFMLTRGNDVENADRPEAATAEHGLRVGPEDAATKVVIYEDFLCPGCGYLEQATTSALEAAAEAGGISVEYRPFNYLDMAGGYSKRAANAFWVVLAESGPEVAKKFHDALFAEQPDERGQVPDDDWLVEKAVAAGAEEDAVRPGIEDEAYADFVKSSDEAASKAGVRATPTVIIDGETVQGNDLQPVIDRLLGLASQATNQGGATDQPTDQPTE